jgi:hypothetical protein
MAQYAFQVRQGKFSGGSSVVADLADREAAWKAATDMCADMARDIVSELKSEPEWLMEVADETGTPIFRFRFIAESLAQG